MKAAVIGSGAMGSIFGGALTEAGLDTTLVDVSQPLVSRLRADGLTIVSDRGERTIPVSATTSPREVGLVDVALIFVKCYHTESAIRMCAPMIGEHTIVASLQNGWGNGDVLAQVVPTERIVNGVIYHSGTVLDLARVAHTYAGETVVGPFDGSDLGGASNVGNVLTAAGFEVTVTADVKTQIWKKLTMNASTLPVAALTRLRGEHAGVAGPVLDLTDNLAREAVAVGRAMGFDLLAEDELEWIHGLFVGAGEGKASMLQDVEAGRQTEIDVINGAVVQMGERLGVDAPLNRAMAALVKGYERAHGMVS